MRLGGGRERLVRPLEDALRADVDPAAGRHLPEHRQPERLEPAELLPGRPARHEQRVRDQDARGTADGCGRRRRPSRSVRAASRRRRARAGRGRCPRSASWFRAALPGAAVDDELLGVLGDLGVEVVQKHPERRLGLPRARVQLRPARRPDLAEVSAEGLDARVEPFRRADSLAHRRHLRMHARPALERYRQSTIARSGARPRHEAPSQDGGGVRREALVPRECDDARRTARRAPRARSVRSSSSSRTCAR